MSLMTSSASTCNSERFSKSINQPETGHFFDPGKTHRGLRTTPWAKTDPIPWQNWQFPDKNTSKNRRKKPRVQRVNDTGGVKPWRCFLSRLDHSAELGFHFRHHRWHLLNRAPGHFVFPTHLSNLIAFGRTIHIHTCGNKFIQFNIATLVNIHKGEKSPRICSGDSQGFQEIGQLRWRQCISKFIQGDCIGVVNVDPLIHKKMHVFRIVVGKTNPLYFHCSQKNGVRRVPAKHWPIFRTMLRHSSKISRNDCDKSCCFFNWVMAAISLSAAALSIAVLPQHEIRFQNCWESKTNAVKHVEQIRSSCCPTVV